MAKKTAVTGMNIDDLKEGIHRVLPILKTVSSMTANKYDDLVVAFLEQWLANPEAAMASVTGVADEAKA